MAKKKQVKNNIEQSIADIPDDTKKKLEKIKVKLEKYKDKILERFEDNVLGIALLPPSTDEDKKEKINVLILIDDIDSKKMDKEELRDKLAQIMVDTAKQVDKSLNPEILLLSDLWQNCFDAKYELLQMIASAAPIHDKGMLAAIKLSEVHKSMVLKKFEKYIVSYVLAGSLVQGKATSESDIDVFIVIDDTDVKKMTRVELRDKLRAIIMTMGMEAGKMTGIENKINIQVYILTDFWENIKEANPVIFTFLRDGIPLYDRGIFMPWKQLLQMGRVKPSPEAIDMFMHSGDQMLERVKMKLKEIGMEDFFWATITTSQAALMLYGLPPPTPKETPDLLRQIFVKKEKMFDDKHVKTIEKVLKIRKDMEHGTKRDVTGKEIDELYNGTEAFLEAMKKLFEQIQRLREKEELHKSYEDVVIACRNSLELAGKTNVKEADIPAMFKKVLVDKGSIDTDTYKQLKELYQAKKEYDLAKLTRAETNKSLAKARGLLRTLVDYIQRQRSKDLEKARYRVRYADKFGEVLMLGTKAYIILDIDNPEKEIRVAKVSKTGKFTDIKSSNLQELEVAIMESKSSEAKYIKEGFFEDLKNIFGNNVEILVNY